MGHRLHIGNELEQDPDSEDKPLVGLAGAVQSEIVSAAHIAELLVFFEPPDDTFCGIRGLVMKQADDLSAGQRTVLLEPVKHIALFG